MRLPLPKNAGWRGDDCRGCALFNLFKRFSGNNKTVSQSPSMMFGRGGDRDNYCPSSSGYDVVNDRGIGKRRSTSVETKEEDKILPTSQRLKLLSLTRDGLRNAPQVRAIIQQLRVLIVGLQGGKVTFTTEDETWNKKALEAFSEFAESVDFVDGTSLNESLKLILTSLAAEGGDFAMVFDDGLLSGKTGSGKFRFFESDNIANMEPAEFEKRFGTKWTQSNGLIYDDLGRFVGIIVSGKKRGKSVFSKDECFSMLRNPDQPWTESDWFFGKRKWRLIQGRGVSPQAVAIAALIDMYELLSSEVSSSKINAKLFAQLIDEMDVAEEVDDGDVDSGAKDLPIPGESDSQDVPPSSGPEPAEPKIDPDDLSSDHRKGDRFDPTPFEANAGGIVFNPPAKTKLQILDTKRPNPNTVAFVEFLNGGAAAVHGLARVYAGLKAEVSYTAYRGEQCITMSSVEEGQKELERGPLTWMAVKRIRWCISMGFIPKGPAGWEKKMEWAWPAMREVNEVDAQNATKMKIRNMLTTYRALLGANWKNILSEVSSEVKWFAENGLIHPSTVSDSGQELTVATNNDPAKRGGDSEK
jgi:hypothetical protein